MAKAMLEYLERKAPFVGYRAWCVRGRQLKGKSAMAIFEKFSQLRRNFRGHHFWARGYYVSTVGLDEAKIRKYIRDQETNESLEDRYDADLSNPF